MTRVDAEMQPGAGRSTPGRQQPRSHRYPSRGLAGVLGAIAADALVVLS